jgi:hypothetical protein
LDTFGAEALSGGSTFAALLAALAVGGWAFRKWRDRRRAHATYPSSATPATPASDTRSPS